MPTQRIADERTQEAIERLETCVHRAMVEQQWPEGTDVELVKACVRLGCVPVNILDLDRLLTFVKEGAVATLPKEEWEGSPSGAGVSANQERREHPERTYLHERPRQG